MSDFNHRTMSTRASAAVIDQGLRSYMLRVYNHMALGLVITGIVAFAIYNAAVQATDTGLALTGFGQFLFVSPFKFVVIFAPLAAVMFLSFRIASLSVATAQI